jgi:hypothetical protein
MKALISNKNKTVTLKAQLRDTDLLNVWANNLFNSCDANSPKKYSIQKGFAFEAIELSFSDYFFNDVKTWLAIHKPKR